MRLVHSLSLVVVTFISLVYGFPGRVYKIDLPSRIPQGGTFSVTVYFSGYPVTFVDLGIVWGLREKDIVCDNCVGEQIGYTNLDVPGSTFKASRTFVVSVPDYYQGDYTLVALIPFIVGIEGAGNFQTFTQNCTVSRFPPHIKPPTISYVGQPTGPITSGTPLTGSASPTIPPVRQTGSPIVSLSRHTTTQATLDK
ncbi:hypothetical protein TREMEDRAFT_62447 [Tremella mesenterica DSM 1558]|uniref:uncharacterized protein n=1 Tax=Tremella mesenterica (strain ATCC 24925 / CBS 8224 / DSM 1558 / NBRC 9311 / NRRL Y-6157 / RJB 2259-6 / UBC 559-6) TaxID=578456 RepID=UPI0003F4A36B|nr:uncharacterized protein TREMEDRAFT_62447 [Tremella mesenterica DSM 1558]EIW69587.1 hypothetical protein TREMEDRAFT_62447 [Tremella mesenterica DSM 1558]